MAKQQKQQDQINQLLSERQVTHGSYLGKAILIQDIKNVMREHGSWKSMDADMQESLDMIVTKMARILIGDPYHHDSWIDIAGYAMLVANRLQHEGGINERTK
jgi:hypothetical protein